MLTTDFAIDMPTQGLTIPLNSTNCDQGDDLLKTKLDEQKDLQMSLSKVSKYKTDY